MEKKYYKEGAWWTSPYNERAAEPIRGSVEIHDATLRDGEQTPGVVFSQEDKLAIADGLMEVGVSRIEAGMPAVSRDDFQAIRQIAKKYPQAKIFSFARATRKDIDLVVDSGSKGVVIEVPIGKPKLKYQFHWEWEDVFEKSADCINYARANGLYTLFFPYDATRAEEDDLESLLKAIRRDAMPDAVGIVDTMGCALPSTIRYMVKWYKEILGDIPVEVHTHNDFGLAVATELAGAEAGASVVHSCVNGLGERTGNAALEELVVCMNILYGMDTPYRLEPMPALCSLVEKLSGVPCAPNKPFVGARNYTRESGIGVDLVVKEPLAMFATDPRYFNRTAQIALGKKSGKASVTYYLGEMGVQADDEQIAAILAQVKQTGTQQKRLLTKDEFMAIVQAVL